MLRTFIILSSFLFATSVGAVNPDFYRQQKIKKEMRVKRAKGAKSFTRGRQTRSEYHKKKAKAYTKERREIEKSRKKREKLFAKDLDKKLKFRSRKVAQAEKSAKKRRKKSSVSWKDENIEYGISRPKLRLKFKPKLKKKN